MRINQYIAKATGMSRRAADRVVEAGRVTFNDTPVTSGQDVGESEQVRLDNKPLKLQATTTIMLNKPVGYVCSRDGQGSQTVYELIPQNLHHLKPVGRLDKDSSGLLLMTNDGNLANELTHPSKQKQKVYEVTLNKALSEEHKQQIITGVKLEDGISKLSLSGTDNTWTITMAEGRNRQIRRTFEALGYRINTLKRTQFGPYQLNQVTTGKYTENIVE